MRRLRALSKRAKMLAAGSGAIIILLVAFLVVTLSSGTGGVVACKEGYVRSSFTQKCVRAGDPNFGETRSGEREHTPTEEQAHNKSLETEQREEKEQEEAQKAVEEDETRVEGGTSIRKTEEKVCYESGKTSEECKGPLKETPQEERSEAENKARQQQSQEESTGQPAVVE
jgi:FtsZ-interacting cell division protein ZipA